jgi:hypothetical protein
MQAPYDRDRARRTNWPKKFSRHQLGNGMWQARSFYFSARIVARRAYLRSRPECHGQATNSLIAAGREAVLTRNSLAGVQGRRGPGAEAGWYCSTEPRSLVSSALMPIQSFFRGLLIVLCLAVPSGVLTDRMGIAGASRRYCRSSCRPTRKSTTRACWTRLPRNASMKTRYVNCGKRRQTVCVQMA